MKKSSFPFLLFLLIPMITFCQSIHGIKIGYEVSSEGPFPTSKVFHGDTIIIVWQSTDISGDIRIEMRHENHNLATVIAPLYPINDLPKDYRIPNTLAPGKYYIKISQGIIANNSSLFTIMGPRTIKWVNVFLEGEPMPKKGFKIGQTIAVSWDTSHILGKVTVLCKRGQSLNTSQRQTRIISKNRPAGDIPATYKIPKKTVPGTYRVEVRQGEITGVSKFFKVRK